MAALVVVAVVVARAAVVVAVVLVLVVLAAVVVLAVVVVAVASAGAYRDAESTHRVQIARSLSQLRTWRNRWADFCQLNQLTSYQSPLIQQCRKPW